MKKIKHYFASANTGENFVCHFDQINTEKNPFLYIIKGGPGTGKSSMMKKVGKHFENAGYEIEYYHCSSDPSSLDGVRLKKFNIAIIDGTAPHTFDADIPCVTGKIVNVGEFISSDIKNKEEKIVKLLKNKKICFGIVYDYLKSAKNIFEVNKHIQKMESKKDFNKQAGQIIENLKIENQNKHHSEKTLFRNIVFGNYIVNFDIDNEYSNVYSLESNEYESNEVLKKIREKLISFGYNFTTFKNPICPSDIDSLYIENTDTLIRVSSTKISNISIKSNNKLIKELLKKTGQYLNKAIKNHKNVEKYYISAVNFEKLDEITISLIKEIEKRVLK